MKYESLLIKKAIFTFFIFFSLMAFGSAIASSAALDKYIKLFGKIDDIDQKYSMLSASKDSIDGEFIIKEYENKIGIFNSKGEFQYSIEVYIKTLPEKDRQMLKNGIFAGSYEELYEILGDYNS